MKSRKGPGHLGLHTRPCTPCPDPQGRRRLSGPPPVHGRWVSLPHTHFSSPPCFLLYTKDEITKLPINWEGTINGPKAHETFQRDFPDPLPSTAVLPHSVHPLRCERPSSDARKTCVSIVGRGQGFRYEGTLLLTKDGCSPFGTCRKDRRSLGPLNPNSFKDPRSRRGRPTLVGSFEVRVWWRGPVFEGTGGRDH